MVRASAPWVLNSEGCGSSTVRANRLTASWAEVEVAEAGSRRSKIWMSDMPARRSRSEAGHISSHVPTIAPRPPPCTNPPSPPSSAASPAGGGGAARRAGAT
jgi:hypothetical protein